MAIHLTGLVAGNSVAFVEAMLRLTAERRPFVVLSSASARALPGIVIDTIETPEGGGGWASRQQPIVPGPETAQISFTSGTTGTPKGILLPYDAFADTTERLTAVMHLTPDAREYVGAPPNYSFGMARFRALAAIGGNAYLPTHGFDPAEIGRMLGAGQINALSAVPTLIRLLIENADLLGAARHQLRWLEIGSQHMGRNEKERVKSIFPNARIIQHYGLTEASRTTFLDISEAEGDRLESVGSPVGATEIEITVDGHIRIRGPHVARQWANADGLQPLTDDNGWLTTNDLGFIDDGHLHFRGRVDDLINCGGIKLSPELLESEISRHLKLPARFNVARFPDAIRGDGILVATDDPGLDLGTLSAAAAAVLREHGISAGNALKIERFAELPQTENGKIQRRVLTGMLIAAITPTESAAPTNSRFQRLLSSTFPGRIVECGDSFSSLGGDSLSYIRFSMEIERTLGHLPDHWENLTADEFDAMAHQAEPEQNSGTRSISSEMLVRVGAVSTVVIGHIGNITAVKGGGAVLLMIAGYNLARFQGARLAAREQWSVLADFAKRILLPAYLMILVIAGLSKSVSLDVPTILLVSSYFGSERGPLLPYWFIEILLQAIVLTVLLHAVPQVRRIATSTPWFFALGLLAIGVAAKLVVPFVVEFHQIAGGDRTLDAWFYAFALGWVLAAAVTKPEKWTALILVIALCAYDWALIDSHTIWMVLASTVILYIPRVPLWTPLARLVVYFAQISFFVYLGHMLAIQVVRWQFHLSSPILALIGSVILGAIMFQGWELVSRLGSLTAMNSKRLGDRQQHDDDRRQRRDLV